MNSKTSKTGSSAALFSPGAKQTKHAPFLGRYHQQITALEEGNKRAFLGWITPGFEFFTIKNLALSKMFFGQRLKLNTSTNGSHRALVPHGNYDDVMPLDILPNFLIRATRDPRPRRRRKTRHSGIGGRRPITMHIFVFVKNGFWAYFARKPHRN